MKKNLVIIFIGLGIFMGTLWLSHYRVGPIINGQFGAKPTPAKELGQIIKQIIDVNAIGNEPMVYIETSDGWRVTISADSIKAVFNSGVQLESKKQAVRDYLTKLIPKASERQVITIDIDDNGNVVNITYEQ